MPTSRVIIVLYAFTAMVNIMASARGPASLDWATTPILMPLLVGVLIAAAHEAGRRPSRLMIAGLVLAAAANAFGEFFLSGGLPVWVTVTYVVGQLAIVYGWITRRPLTASD